MHNARLHFFRHFWPVLQLLNSHATSHTRLSKIVSSPRTRKHFDVLMLKKEEGRTILVPDYYELLRMPITRLSF